ncbi:hypothetical protein [Amycolatopsis sp. cmx-4-68]|uniref:hypothetical protein n=1 Tax=Amycolatopsis sp. cmx-4-68 TaxID=2790938 RepID=UPI00397A1D17
MADNPNMAAKQKRVLWLSLALFVLAAAMMFFVIRTPVNWVIVGVLAVAGLAGSGLLLRVARRPPYR